MRPTRYLAVFVSACFVLSLALSSVSDLGAQSARIPALMSLNEGKGLVITTHGSGWFFRDDYWRYPAFKDFQESFDFVNRLELEQVLQEFRGLTLEQYQSMDLSFELGQGVEGALIFDLTGTSPDYQGLRLSMTVRDPGGITYRSSNYISERSLHIDQPGLGKYSVGFYTDGGASFSLRVGIGRSPFLTTELQGYSFLLIPDVDPLTSREISNVNQFIQRGGNLIVLSELIRGERYFSSSNFVALNPLLRGCGIQFTGQVLTTTNYTIANSQRINILTNVVPHVITQDITNVVSTGAAPKSATNWPLSTLCA